MSQRAREPESQRAREPEGLERARGTRESQKTDGWKDFWTGTDNSKPKVNNDHDFDNV